ncbi:hypothetical protein I7I53_08278 [Histoplasma capsulatum var. duboisii H88]|uniref:Uncharacterized protein n=1 Tax=Ajellomyces capsulatus (strain H88) TaxID=544711 RepID=A0A8A1LDW5_AJEC8|nr:hypothetical protein I7I53_08278 [Histoplasma capsulatum var. duboisii H88]
MNSQYHAPYIRNIQGNFYILSVPFLQNTVGIFNGHLDLILMQSTEYAHFPATGGPQAPHAGWRHAELYLYHKYFLVEPDALSNYFQINDGPGKLSKTHHYP